MTSQRPPHPTISLHLFVSCSYRQVKLDMCQKTLPTVYVRWSCMTEFSHNQMKNNSKTFLGTHSFFLPLFWNMLHCSLWKYFQEMCPPESSRVQQCGGEEKVDSWTRLFSWEHLLPLRKRPCRCASRLTRLDFPPSSKYQKSVESRCPTSPFTIVELKNPSYDVPELHRIRRSTDSENWWLREDSSGTSYDKNRDNQ